MSDELYINIEDTKQGLVVRLEHEGFPSTPADYIRIDIDNSTYALTIYRDGDDVYLRLDDAVSPEPLFEGGWSNDWEGMLEGEDADED
jgi:hypothetical protein